MAKKGEPLIADNYAKIVEAFEHVHLDESKLPPELRDCFDLQELKDALPNAKSFSILVCGKTGTGKSTLVNGILGKVVVNVGENITRQGETIELHKYSQNIDGVDVAVWDSPGLQDGTDNHVQSGYVSDMQEKCSNVELTLYCIRMFEKRFPRGTSDNPDVNAMARMTAAFGPDFWRKTVVVLTHANVVEAMNVRWKNLDVAVKAVAFQEELERWRGIIQDVLINEINVPEEIAMSVVVAPAGHYDTLQLPDRDYWLSTFWFQCLEVIASPEGRVALVRINALRIKHRKNVKEEDLERPLEEQSLVVEGFIPSYQSTKYKSWGSIPFIVGGGIGATAGASVGALGGAIGVAIGAPVGFTVGIIAAAVARGLHLKRNRDREAAAKEAAAKEAAANEAAVAKEAASKLSEESDKSTV